MSVKFTLYSRTYCHLCDDMLTALQALQAEFAFTIQVEDVDADPTLVELYDELVPVLVGWKDGMESRLCHYFFDDEQVRAYLRDGAKASA